MLVSFGPFKDWWKCTSSMVWNSNPPVVRLMEDILQPVEWKNKTVVNNGISATNLTSNWCFRRISSIKTVFVSHSYWYQQPPSGRFQGPTPLRRHQRHPGGGDACEPGVLLTGDPRSLKPTRKTTTRVVQDTGCNWLYAGVSKNKGTPKWMVYNGKPY